MFYEMCGVEMSGNKTQRTQELCAVKPLENGAAFEVVDGIETWHPVWDARVDHIINAQFLKSVVERIWNNEKVAESVATEIRTHPLSCRIFATPKGRVN
jgi:hypothetical protein